LSNVQIQAIVVEPSASGGLAVGVIAAPTPTPTQVLIEVRHVSLNHGDVVRARLEKPGTALGFDASGIVVRAADDGGGPPVGARVVAWSTGTWAQRIAVDADRVAIVPSAVDLAVAAALPAAGLAALRALRAAGPILGKRVLVTGAAGGVGRYAVQLAALGGAHVVAAVGSAARGAGLSALGAHEIVIGAEGIRDYAHRVDGVVENVGGPYLVAAVGRLASGGNLQSVGWASMEAAVFPPYGLFGLGGARTIVDASGILFGDGDIGKDLRVLVGNVAAGRLSAEVGWRRPWTWIAEAATLLADRALAGKAVLDVEPLGASPGG